MNSSLRNTTLLSLLAAFMLLLGCSKNGGGSAAAVAWSDKPDAFVQQVIDQIQQKNPAALWSALPERYQKETTELFHLAGQKLDAKVYDRAFGLVGKVAQLLDSKQEFILNTPLMADSKDDFAKVLPSIIKLMRSVSESQFATVDGLSKLDMQQVLATTAKDLIVEMDTIAKITGEDFTLDQLKDAVVTLVDQTGDVAEVSVEIPGQDAETQTLKLVDGRWLPESFVSDFDAGIAEARSNLEALTPEMMQETSMQAAMFFPMIEGMISSLQNASSQEEFDAALGGLQQMIPMGAMGGGEGGLPFF